MWPQNACIGLHLASCTVNCGLDRLRLCSGARSYCECMLLVCVMWSRLCSRLSSSFRRSWWMPSNFATDQSLIWQPRTIHHTSLHVSFLSFAVLAQPMPYVILVFKVLIAIETCGMYMPPYACSDTLHPQLTALIQTTNRVCQSLSCMQCQGQARGSKTCQYVCTLQEGQLITADPG